MFTHTWTCFSSNQAAAEINVSTFYAGNMLYMPIWGPFVAFVLVLVYFLLQVIYRLYWSPLARFPGPKSAAVSFAYEFYFDVWKPGMFVWEIERLHQIYGGDNYSLGAVSAFRVQTDIYLQDQ